MIDSLGLAQWVEALIVSNPVHSASFRITEFGP